MVLLNLGGYGCCGWLTAHKFSLLILLGIAYQIASKPQWWVRGKGIHTTTLHESQLKISVAHVYKYYINMTSYLIIAVIETMSDTVQSTHVYASDCVHVCISAMQETDSGRHTIIYDC